MTELEGDRQKTLQYRNRNEVWLADGRRKGTREDGFRQRDRRKRKLAKSERGGGEDIFELHWA